MKLKQTIRHAEIFTSRTEVDPYVPIKFIMDNNVSRLLLELRPFVKTQHFRRYNEDSGYIESRIWLPYVKNEVVKNLESRMEYEIKYNTSLQERIDNYNKLSWWGRMFIDV